MASRSITSRFAVTVASNLLRGGISFVTGIVLARGLGPEHYGNFAFLLGSFTAIRQLLEVGTSSAFYTFISRRPRGRRFLLWHAAWQVVQFIIPFVGIGLIMPSAWIDVIWVGQQRGLVLLAFVAAFLQQQAWLMVSQIGESRRLTHRVQSLNVGIAVLHLLLVVVFWKTDFLSVTLVFSIIAAEYVIAMVVGLTVLGTEPRGTVENVRFGVMVREYAHFCKPMVLYSWLSFMYSFADNWLLQHFGGAREQAFFSVGFQFATVSLLATTSMLNIFWKEIAEAHARDDLDRVAQLYKRTSRLLFMIAAAVSGFLMPWSGEITKFFLGPDYVGGAIVLAIMFLYPIHQSVGQITGTMFFATGRTRPQAIIQMAGMAVSIPLTYVVQASPEVAVPGLALGAIGLALKMIVLQLVIANVMAWWIARSFHWNFEWGYQIIGIGVPLILGWSAFELALAITGLVDTPIVIGFVLAGTIYSGLLCIFLWTIPSVVGLRRDELLRLFSEMRSPYRGSR